MLELLIGFGVASAVGMGGTYVALMLFAMLFPNGFRIAYWMFMVPIMSIGFGSLLWLFGGFFTGWGTDAYKLWLAVGTLLGLTFCWFTAPTQRS